MRDMSLETLVSLAKRRGFIFQGSELYGGLAGTWDYGPLGVRVRDNIVREFHRVFLQEREDTYPLDSAILLHPKVWEASGHARSFADPLVRCASCGGSFRADHLDDPSRCPRCGGTLGTHESFNLMVRALVGTSEETHTFLRPETAQGIFINFKNIVDALHPKLPFGVVQVGKAFRNEIAPREFLFRAREFEQLEVEYFVHPSQWEAAFEDMRQAIWRFLERVGIDCALVREVEVPEGERAHYSQRTIDFEFAFPFGQRELCGLAYRTDYDLRRHSEHSGIDLRWREGGGEPFYPHVIEPSIGVGRVLLAVLASAYDEDEVGGERRVVLRLAPEVAPYRVAVFPLVRNKPALVAKAREVFQMLRQWSAAVTFDDNGNIGKRYRRQDEVGTPWCVTVDYQTLDDETVTVRHRDTTEQTRIPIDNIPHAVGMDAAC